MLCARHYAKGANSHRSCMSHLLFIPSQAANFQGLFQIQGLWILWEGTFILYFVEASGGTPGLYYFCWYLLSPVHVIVEVTFNGNTKLGEARLGLLLLLFSLTPWIVACQALLSMGFPGQEYQSGLSFLSPGDLPNPGIEPTCPARAGRFVTAESPGKPY